jgi:hypothetical protein
MSNEYLIESEILRSKIYNRELIDWIHLQLNSPIDSHKIKHLVIRYLFNKIITRQCTDDPVFIITESKYAETQLQNDLKYYNISELDLHSRFIYCYNLFKERSKFLHRDLTPTLKDGIIKYGYTRYSDISNLSYNNPDKINYALALNIRYTYLYLTTQGLARDFKNMKYTTDMCTEAFGTSFNRYFNNYCSAFPDLESVFGSRGSFFEIDSWNTPIVYVNPPFDETVMNLAINRILNYIESHSNCKQLFIFTLPNWPQWNYLEQLKNSRYTTDIKIYLKSDKNLPFIDYMNECKIIYPCDIAEVFLGDLSLLPK